MTKHKDIIKVIDAIRGSFLDSSIVYTFGGCYGFYEILKSIHKEAKAYQSIDDRHVVTKIGDKYYDIYGE